MIEMFFKQGDCGGENNYIESRRAACTTVVADLIESRSHSLWMIGASLQITHVSGSCMDARKTLEHFAFVPVFKRY